MSDTTLVKVTDLMPGDRIDLEADPYADPQHDHSYYEFEYVEVFGVERETPSCVRVDFEGSPSVGFPPDHLLKVRIPREGQLVEVG